MHKEQIEPFTWPPAYKIKKHKRARSVKFRVSAKHGLEITVPYRFNLRNIPAILAENKAWIAKHFLQVQILKTSELPTQIHFSAIQEVWSIHYEPCKTKLTMIERPLNSLVLVGNIYDHALCKKKLLAWVKKKAQLYLTQSLAYFSEFTQLSYERLTIRDQQTLWGSCTAKKAISLNYKLLLLPKYLADYVIIHELCHTKHLNHSEKFWHLVAQYDPHCKQHRKELRQANQLIPAWMY
ncbi:MAG: M48 family metallopeptidase [Gammaproteobacteria bacterium]|nr:M48 family metallopeptidase [Gammaproteobacteria bacterium]